MARSRSLSTVRRERQEALTQGYLDGRVVLQDRIGSTVGTEPAVTAEPTLRSLAARV